MAYVFPAYFYKEDGQYSVIFPDLNDLATCGNNLADVLYMAEDAMGLYLFTVLRDHEPIPVPPPIENLHDPEAEFVNMVMVDMKEYAKKHGDKAVKKTLTIPTWLNTLCEDSNINFSKVLQEALIERIQVK